MGDVGSSTSSPEALIVTIRARMSATKHNGFHQYCLERAIPPAHRHENLGHGFANLRRAQGGRRMRPLLRTRRNSSCASRPQRGIRPVSAPPGPPGRAFQSWAAAATAVSVMLGSGFMGAMASSPYPLPHAPGQIAGIERPWPGEAAHRCELQTFQYATAPTAARAGTCAREQTPVSGGEPSNPVITLLKQAALVLGGLALAFVAAGVKAWTTINSLRDFEG